MTLGGSVAITAMASSPEARPLTYSWSASSGTISGSGNTATLNTSGAAAGTITVTCRVADDQGRTASSTMAVTVNAPISTPPTINCSANPSAVTLGGSAAITAVASSPETRPLTYSWSASSGTISGSGNTATLNTSSAAAGTITVTCRVADDQGRSASATTAVTVNAPISTPPTISCSANPSAITLGGSAAISAVASSPEARPLTYSWSASSGTISGSGNAATLNTSGTAAGTIMVTCGVADDQGRSASATTAVTVNASATGNTYYVTPSGSNSNPCTQASPCATPDYAFNVASPGDTVQVAAGTYNYGSSAAEFTKSGTAGHYITVTCATRGACKIQNSVTGNRTVVVLGGSYITFDGFEVTNTSAAGNNLGLYVTSSFVNITRNTIHHIETDCGSSGGGGIQIAGSGSSNSGLQNITIDSNLIYDINYPGGSPSCGKSTVQSDGILLESAGTANQVTNNIVYHTSGGWGILVGNSNDTFNSVDTVISNNTVFSTTGGIIIMSGAGTTISNNIVADTGLTTGRCGISAPSGTLGHLCQQ